MGGHGHLPRVRGGRFWVVAVALALVAAPACAGESDGNDGTSGSTTSSAVVTTTTGGILSPDAIPVLRSVALIPAGTGVAEAVEAGLVESITVSRAEFPVDGVVTAELIEGRQAVADIPAGTILTLGLFTPE